MTGPQDPFATPDPNAPREPSVSPQPYAPQPYAPQPYGTAPVAGNRNGLGTASMVLGILSLLSWFIFIGGLFGLIAIVLGFLGRGRARRREASNGGVALAGIVMGTIGLLLTVLVVAVGISLFTSGEFSNLTDCLSEAGGDQEAIDECTRQFEDSVR